MKNRPVSAYPLNSSQSHKVIKWTSNRPGTAINEYLKNPTYPTQSAKTIDINISIDSVHANLPKDTLGSRLMSKLPRPKTATVKLNPSFKVNTFSLSKEFLPASNDNKQERIDLIHKLRKFCNTRSAQLLENTIKEEKIIKNNTNKDLIITEVKKIWDGFDFQRINIESFQDKSVSIETSENKITRPASAVKTSKSNIKLNHIIVPGLNTRPESATLLTIIPEHKLTNREMYPIDANELKYYKRPCDLKLFNIELADNKKKSSGFRGKFVKRMNKGNKAKIVKVENKTEPYFELI